MTRIEKNATWKRMEIQNRIQEILEDLREWGKLTQGEPDPQIEQIIGGDAREDRERLHRISAALKAARDCE